MTMDHPGHALEERRHVGTTSLHLPVLGLGAAPLGRLYEDVSDEVAARTIEHALEVGISYIDTAPLYGLGLAERRIGQVLAKDVPRPVLSSKVGRIIAADDNTGGALTAVHSWDRDAVFRSFEDSLTRLAVDGLDIVFIHDPDEAEHRVTDETFPALAELREQGLVKAIGVAMNSWEMPARFVRTLDIDVLMVAGRYNLLDTSAADVLLPLCAQRKVSVVIGGVLATGVLATGDPDSHYNYQKVPPTVQDRVRRILDVCDAHGASISGVALQFPLAHAAVASVVVGMRSPQEVDVNVAAINESIPDQLWTDLKDNGVLPEDSEVPTAGVFS